MKREKSVCVCGWQWNISEHNPCKKCTKEREKKNKNWTKGIFCSNWIPWMENTTKHREREREKGYTRNQRKIFQTIVFLSPPFLGCFYIYIFIIYKDRLFFRSVLALKKQRRFPTSREGVWKRLVMDIGFGCERASRTFLLLVVKCQRNLKQKKR